MLSLTPRPPPQSPPSLQHGLLFFETSAKTGKNVDRAFNGLLHAVYRVNVLAQQQQQQRDAAAAGGTAAGAGAGTVTVDGGSDGARKKKCC